jgi:hypothetical protein|tara:strand:- start:34182 stop:35111 length:930 start_codon:yes stop_codon:yes gene_type:complete
MIYSEWIEIIPSALSAVAAIAAAYAAFRSLAISREAKQFSEQHALAVHHGLAANALADVQQVIAKELKSLSDLADWVATDWAGQIGRLDRPSEGGRDPRPLKHVLSNGAEMLAWHASKHGANNRSAGNRMYSILRSGMGSTSEDECRDLMVEADGTWHDFEALFGIPRVEKSIQSSPAFRWVYYQLIHRISAKDWADVWTKALQDDSWLSKFGAEYQRVTPVLRGCLERLHKEKARLAVTVFPLEINSRLNDEYGRLIEFAETLLEHDYVDHLNGYVEDLGSDDVVCLVLFSMGAAVLTTQFINGALYD